MTNPRRVLIEDWLPAAAIGVECIRERSTGQQPPDKRLHIWWARRPLAISRAAVLASLLPADFPRDVFERLLGFGQSSKELVTVRRLLDSKPAGTHLDIGFKGGRAFHNGLQEDDLRLMDGALRHAWGRDITVLDPMAGGGSIPLEAARLGLRTFANEYNPVACSVLEAISDYPFRFGAELAAKTRKWAKAWQDRVSSRLAPFYHEHPYVLVRDYIFARTVPCPNTGHHTPLVPDWHLSKPSGHTTCGPSCIFAVPVFDVRTGVWSVRIERGGRNHRAPRPTYVNGQGFSLFSGYPDQPAVISAEYLKSNAEAGQMRNALYALVLKTPQGLAFEPPQPPDLAALQSAEAELAIRHPAWERANIIPTEAIPAGDKTSEPIARGMHRWPDMFSPRQLLAMGILVEELRALYPQIIAAEGQDMGDAIAHLLALVVDKSADYNSSLSIWHAARGVMVHVFARHDFSFKATFAEIGPCEVGGGPDWATESVLDAYQEIARLPRHSAAQPVQISLGSATNLPQIAGGSITAVVVDPPYAGNVQYSELADFFYVWLKRTQGHRHPDWFSSYLSQHDQEAVVNLSRFRSAAKKTGQAKAEANAFYQQLMADVFAECRRILCDDGVLTVMFTHKKQEAWESLFASLVKAGFTITATWPVKTESEHTLNQARKNAAQSTVLLVARKRPDSTGVGYYDTAMQHEIGQRARDSAIRLQGEGLNPVDQLVGSFGPAMEVYSRYSAVRTDTGIPVTVGQALEQASDAVTAWRIEQLAAHGLAGVEPEGRFALLCWDVLGAAEFRFNEAKLLGHAVGMDVAQLELAGLVAKEGNKINILSAQQRRRDRALEPDEVIDTLFGPVTAPKKRTKKDALKVHPNDPQFRTALDSCHALALRYIEAGGGDAGLGVAKALVRQQAWTQDSAVAELMEALVHAAPVAVRHPAGPKSAAELFPEFRAWHALLQPLFAIVPPDWTLKEPIVLELPFDQPAEPESEGEDDEEEPSDDV